MSIKIRRPSRHLSFNIKVLQLVNQLTVNIAADFVTTPVVSPIDPSHQSKKAVKNWPVRHSGSVIADPS
jgi:hypothetical protein